MDLLGTLDEVMKTVERDPKKTRLNDVFQPVGELLKSEEARLKSLPRADMGLEELDKMVEERRAELEKKLTRLRTYAQHELLPKQ